MSSQAPIDVEVLPPATDYITMPRTAPPVGKYVGPGTTGEWFTVVSRDALAHPKWRIGLARGCYTINGHPTDSDGLPPDVQFAQWQADFSTWQPARRLYSPPVNDPDATVKITDAGGNDA